MKTIIKFMVPVAVNNIIFQPIKYHFTFQILYIQRKVDFQNF